MTQEPIPDMSDKLTGLDTGPMVWEGEDDFNPKKIIIFGNTSNTGWTMAKTLRRAGHLVWHIIPMFTEHCIKLHSHITEYPHVFVPYQDCLKILDIWLEKINPNKVLTMFTPDACEIVYNYNPEIDNIYLANGSDVRSGWDERIEKYCDRIFYSTPDLEHTPNRPSKAKYLPNCADPDLFHDMGEKDPGAGNRVLMKLFNRQGIINDDMAVEKAKEFVDMGYCTVDQVTILKRWMSFEYYYKMPSFLSKFGLFWDFKYSPITQEWLPLSKTALEALAMGLIVENPTFGGALHETPEQHTFENVSQMWFDEVFELEKIHTIVVTNRGLYF